MQLEVVISGFGGQGSLFAGQLLAYAALDFGRHVTWIPSYGPEMRGGTAHCTVVISDKPIGSPLVRQPGAVVALNLPSFSKYEALLKPGGILIYNSSLIEASQARGDIRYCGVPANTVAESLGTVRSANVVLLGALLQMVEVLPLEAVEQALDDHLPERQLKYLEINKRALRQGAALALHARPLEPTQRGV